MPVCAGAVPGRRGQPRRQIGVARLQTLPVMPFLFFPSLPSFRPQGSSGAAGWLKFPCSTIAPSWQGGGLPHPPFNRTLPCMIPLSSPVLQPAETGDVGAVSWHVRGNGRALGSPKRHPVGNTGSKPAAGRLSITHPLLLSLLTHFRFYHIVVQYNIIIYSRYTLSLLSSPSPCYHIVVQHDVIIYS